MTDDQFESFLQREARDYNAPPPVPRDAIWERIDAERRARGALPLHGGVRSRVWWVAAAAIAAMLLLGIGIGYVWRGTIESPRISPRTAERQTPAAVAPEKPGPTAPPRASGSAEPRGAPAPERSVAVSPSPVRPRDRGTTAPARRESAAYAAITAEHLGRVETLLTSFRVESERGKVDPQITSWAGDLLGTTRLLIDSPGASDPQLHKLLGDLEIVLTQITQLHERHGSERDELQLIDQSLRSRDMMTRIRGATPAGAGALPIGT